MSEGHLIIRIALTLISAAEPLNHRLFQNQFATEMKSNYYQQSLKKDCTEGNLNSYPEPILAVDGGVS